MKDPVFKAILKYIYFYSNVLKIRKTWENSIFCFHEVSMEEIKTEIYKFSSKKDSQIVDTPARIIKKNRNTFVHYLPKSINAMTKFK